MAKFSALEALKSYLHGSALDPVLPPHFFSDRTYCIRCSISAELVDGMKVVDCICTT